MRKLLGFGLALFLSGCATSSMDVMQPDHTYRIVSERDTVFVGSGRMIDQAHRHAYALCPNGYDVKSEFRNSLKVYTLIVACKDQLVLPDKIENVKDPETIKKMQNPEAYRSTGCEIIPMELPPGSFWEELEKEHPGIIEKLRCKN